MQSPLTLYHMWPCQALSLRPGRLHGLCRSITDSKWAWKHQGFHPAPLTCHVHGQGYVERAFRDPPPAPAPPSDPPFSHVVLQTHPSMVPRSSALVTRTPKPHLSLSVMHKPPLLEKLDFAGGSLSVWQRLRAQILRGPVSLTTGSRAVSEATVLHLGDSHEDAGRLQMTA